MVSDRALARYRDLRAAESTGAWQVHLLAGAASADDAATVAGVLAAGIDLSAHGYTSGDDRAAYRSDTRLDRASLM